MARDIMQTKMAKSSTKLVDKHAWNDSGINEYVAGVYNQRLSSFVKKMVKQYPPRLLKNALEWYKALPDRTAAEIPFEEVVIRFAGENVDQLTTKEQKIVIDSAKNLPTHPLDREVEEPEYDEGTYSFKKKGVSAPKPISSEQFKKLSSSDMKKVIERSKR